jgi:hypothetical protein
VIQFQDSHRKITADRGPPRASLRHIVHHEFLESDVFID